MRISGLSKIFAAIANAPRSPLKWGITAVEKDQLRQPRSASKKKKGLRKMIQAAQRRNRE